MRPSPERSQDVRRCFDRAVYGHRGVGDGSLILLANRLGERHWRGSLEGHSPPGTIAGKATGDGFLLKKPLNRKVLKLLDAHYEAKILSFGTVTRRPPASP